MAIRSRSATPTPRSRCSSETWPGATIASASCIRRPAIRLGARGARESAGDPAAIGRGPIPTATHFQSGLAWVYECIGWVVSQTGKPAAVCSRLQARPFDLPAARRRRSHGHSVPEQPGMEPLLYRLVAIADGQAVSGRQCFEKALAIHQGLADANPTLARFQRAAEATMVSAGWITSRAGPLRPELPVGIRLLYERLVKRNPDAPAHQVLLPINGSTSVSWARNAATYCW